MWQALSDGRVLSLPLLPHLQALQLEQQQARAPCFQRYPLREADANATRPTDTVGGGGQSAGLSATGF